MSSIEKYFLIAIGIAFLLFIYAVIRARLIMLKIRKLVTEQRKEGG